MHDIWKISLHLYSQNHFKIWGATETQWVSDFFAFELSDFSESSSDGFVKQLGLGR